MKILLGCDPEAFLQDVNGQLKASIGLIGGSKHAPMPLPIGEGYCVQEDNVALEFNIPPAEGRSQFVDSVRKTLNFLTEAVKERYGFTISNLSAASFPEDQLTDPAALEFGCDPDYNAWTKEVNPKPKAEDWTLRSCGGHVHIGFDKSKVNTEEVMKWMDVYCGVASVVMDSGDKRKQLYGKHGAYRDKPYGGEYRVLSNFWIFNDKLIEWVWDNTCRAVNAAESGLTLSKEDSEAVIQCIDNNDKELANQLIKKFNLEVIHV